MRQNAKHVSPHYAIFCSLLSLHHTWVQIFSLHIVLCIFLLQSLGKTNAEYFYNKTQHNIRYEVFTVVKV
jgi:hypothetical protein